MLILYFDFSKALHEGHFELGRVVSLEELFASSINFNHHVLGLQLIRELDKSSLLCGVLLIWDLEEVF